MKIMKKAKLISDAIAAGDGARAKLIMDQAVAAVLGGRTAPAWGEYMRNFCSNQAQLNRLKGDDGLMDHPYGPLILAYMAGDGNCGGGTTTRVGRNMIDLMKEILDSVDSTTEASFRDEFHEEMKTFNVGESTR